LVVFVVAVATVVAPATASAHLCTYVQAASVGKPSTVTVGATVEEQPVGDLTIEFPAELRIDRAVATPGWVITVDGQNVHYRGGPIEAYGCGYFSVVVNAQAKGTFAVPVRQVRADGSVIVQDARKVAGTLNPYLAQLVYVDTKPPSTAAARRTSPLFVVGVALIAIAVLALAVRLVRSRTRAIERAPDGRQDDAAHDGDARDLDDVVAALREQARERVSRGR
jgi:hypothetical protein